MRPWQVPRRQVRLCWQPGRYAFIIIAKRKDIRTHVDRQNMALDVRHRLTCARQERCVEVKAPVLHKVEKVRDTEIYSSVLTHLGKVDRGDSLGTVRAWKDLCTVDNRKAAESNICCACWSYGLCSRDNNEEDLDFESAGEALVAIRRYMLEECRAAFWDICKCCELRGTEQGRICVFGQKSRPLCSVKADGTSMEGDLRRLIWKRSKRCFRAILLEVEVAGGHSV